MRFQIKKSKQYLRWRVNNTYVSNTTGTYIISVHSRTWYSLVEFQHLQWQLPDWCLIIPQTLALLVQTTLLNESNSEAEQKGNAYLACKAELNCRKKIYTWPAKQKWTVQKHIQYITCATMTIALNTALFSNQIILVFFLFLHKNMLWVLIRSTSMRHF